MLIVGAGKRVRETALPAFRRVSERFAVHGIFARTAKRIDVDGEAFEVRPLETLTEADIAAAELIYVAVAKDAVPPVLKRLAELGDLGADLLIDTPVVRFRHFRHAARLRAFRNAWVAEDCTALP